MPGLLRVHRDVDDDSVGRRGARKPLADKAPCYKANAWRLQFHDPSFVDNREMVRHINPSVA
jgi:hypothetical protein